MEQKLSSIETQQAAILAYLQSNHSLSTFEAREKLDVMHPGSRIQELRAKGHNIITYRRTINGHRKVAEYVLLAAIGEVA
ncbi:helix-turn-helix domain-containing protein [Crenothrix sp.]|uniref:helix-turn-helix domain-containing protein n=1 Tax=Crenothrix sp. TaxID=3100433 RepID=UPI00374D83DD